jgi:hypothetical protein
MLFSIIAILLDSHQHCMSSLFLVPLPVFVIVRVVNSSTSTGAIRQKCPTQVFVFIYFVLIYF